MGANEWDDDDGDVVLDDPPPRRRDDREPVRRWICRRHGCSKTSTNPGDLCDPIPAS